MNRQDFQLLAQERADDARALLAAGRWSGAYYLAGYAVECGLKACIAKLTKADDFPSKDFVAKCWTHSIEALVGAAELRAERDFDRTLAPLRARNWTIVAAWTEHSRYQPWAESDATKLVEAVVEPANGVIPWITARW